MRYRLVRSKALEPLEKAHSTATAWICLFALFMGASAVAPAWGQRKFEQSKEIGIALGTAYYKGDINPNAHSTVRAKMHWGVDPRDR